MWHPFIKLMPSGHHAGLCEFFIPPLWPMLHYFYSSFMPVGEFFPLSACHG